MSKLLLVVIAALALAGSAQAHEGDRWFQTKGGTEDAIEGKWKIARARCVTLSAGGGRYTAHRMDDEAFGASSYDHFGCIVTTETTNRVCAVYAHITGQRWFQVVLTTIVMKGIVGCTPRDLSTRPGYRYS